MNSVESSISFLIVLFYLLWIVGGLYVLYTLQRLRQENARIRAQILEIQERLHTELGSPAKDRRFPSQDGTMD